MMEQSQLSNLIAMLKIAYPYYFKDFEIPGHDKDFIAFVAMFKNQIGMYDYEVVFKAIQKIISYSKFFPSFSELKEECRIERRIYYRKIVESSGEIEDKKDLLDMIDWFSISDKYNDKTLNRILELKKSLSSFSQKYLEDNFEGRKVKF